MDMNMKINKTNRLLLCIAALTVWMLGACDDTMEGTNTLGFPTDTLTYAAYPNDTVWVRINVGANWKLSSNKDWCRTEGESMNTSGKSGQHTVPFIISDKGHGFEADKADISLWMNGESRVIAIVTRVGKAHFMEISGDNGVYAPGQTILLGTSGSMKLQVKSNMASILQSSPAWLKVTKGEGSMELMVVDDSVKYSINNPHDSLMLFNSDTTFRQSFHVQYVGMDAMDLRVKSSIDSLVVSRDAKRCKVGDVRYSTPISFTVEALNDQYKLVSVANVSDSCYLLAKKEQWFDVEDDRRGNILLSFEEEHSGDNRMASLLALPQGIIDSLSNCTEGYEAAMANFLFGQGDNVCDLKEEVRKFRLVKMVQLGTMNITISPEARWDVKVSTDGATYSDAMSGDDIDALDNPIEATITSDFGYKLMCASYDSKAGCALMEVGDSWLDVTDNQKGKVEVRFKANDGNARTLYLFALPLPLIEELEAGAVDFYEALSDRLFDDVDGLLEIKETTELFVIARFVQQANEENSIKVLKRGVESIEVTKETNQEWLAAAAEKGVAANKVFRCNVSLDYKYIINPLLPLSLWDTSVNENKDRIEIYGKSGQKYDIGNMTATDKPFSGEYTMMEEMEGDYMLVQLRANEYEVDPENFIYEYYVKEDFIIYFIDNDTECLKALVLTLE